MAVQSNWHVQTFSATECTGSNGTNCQTYAGYLPINESWIADEPNLVQGTLVARTTGDTCAQAINSNNVWISQWNHTLTRLTYAAPDGTEHEFRDQESGGAPQQILYGQTFSRGSVFQAFDGSDAMYYSSSGALVESGASNTNTSMCGAGTGAFESNGVIGPVTGSLQLRNGTTYTIGGTYTYQGNNYTGSSYVTQIEDRNGNILNLGNPTGAYPMQFTDGLNRTIAISAPSGGANSIQTVTYQ